MRTGRFLSIALIAVSSFSFCYLWRQNEISYCLKHQNIFAIFDIDDDNGSPSDNIYKSYSLVKHLLRDSCINIWLYSLLNKQWIRPLNEDHVQKFFDKDVEAMSRRQIDISDFIKVTSNFPDNEKVTLLYAYSRHEQTLAIADRLGYLQNLIKHEVIFNCMDKFGLTNSFCKAVGMKLPKRNFVLLPNSNSQNLFLLNTLKNPNYNGYEKIQCTDNSNISMLFFHLERAIAKSFYISNIVSSYQLKEELNVIKVVKITPEKGKPPKIIIYENYTLVSLNIDYLDKFVAKGQKLIKIFVTDKRSYKQNQDLLPQYSVGQIINIVVDEDLHTYPIVQGENTIYSSSVDFYHPIFMNTFIGLINKLLRKE